MTVKMGTSCLNAENSYWKGDVFDVEYSIENLRSILRFT
jgi:hypothetical protein